MKESESLGLWWIPSNPDQKVAGSIIFSYEAGISLEIIGSFNIQNNSIDIDNSNQEIILGVIHGKLCTLMNCYQKNGSISFPGIETYKYYIRMALLDYHFKSLEEIKFDKFQIDFTYLKYLSPFKWNLHDSNNENNNLMEYSLSLFTLNEMKANITKCEIFIKQFLQTKYNYQEISVNKSAFMEIILKNKESLENIFKDFIIPLQSFITLASGQANHITSLFFCLQIDGDIKRIEAISKQSIFNTQNDILNTENFLFELYDIKQDFSLILQKWFNLFDVAEDIINLYFSTIYNDKLFLENTFLSRVQALESYHRRIIDQHKSSTDEHKRRLESILENTPLEHKRWLNEELNFSHEPSLEERLRELFQLTNRTISPLINNAEDFLKTVKKIRNYLTHYNNPSDAKLMDKLFRINQVLDFMIQSCLLKELGCSDDRCAELIERNQKYQFLKGLISEQRNLNQS